VPDGDGHEAEQEYLKHFVEQYLTSRGYSVSPRNARVVVAAIASCRAGLLDGPALERTIDLAVDRELLRPAA
jgi:hypothetical protein